MTSDQKLKAEVNYGPHGVGDPDDMTLRKMEKNLLIPQIRRKIVNKEKCPKEIEEYQDCVCKTDLIFAAFRCKDLKLKMANCLEFWNEDEDLYRRAKNVYLEERREYRKTGITKETKEYLTKYINEMKK